MRGRARGIESIKLISLSATALFIGGAVLAVYCSSPDPVSAKRARDGYQYVSSSHDALVVELFRGEISVGTHVDKIVSRIAPHKIDYMGRYAIYEFSDSNYEWKSLIARDDRVVCASVGSCTFDWTFFDSLED